MDNETKKKQGPNKVIVIVFLLIAGLLVAGLMTYQRIGPNAWKRGYDEAARGTDPQGRPWIGAAEPQIIVHEYLDYECPHCPDSHKRLRGYLSGDLDVVRIVRHDYARMRCRTLGEGSRNSRCTMVRAAICAAGKMDFWKFNDAVMENPRPLTGKERKDYPVKTAESLGLNGEMFQECLGSQKTIDLADRLAKEAESNKIRETPSYLVDGERYTLLELFDFLDSRL